MKKPKPKRQRRRERTLLGYEVHANDGREYNSLTEEEKRARYLPVEGHTTPQVLGISGYNMSDEVTVQCLSCIAKCKTTRLYYARKFMRKHFLKFAARGETKRHRQFKLQCRVKFRRQFRYIDERYANQPDSYWQLYVGEDSE